MPSTRTGLKWIDVWASLVIECESMGKCHFWKFIRILVCIGMAANQGAQACCAVAARGVPVVNADQTVIIWWDKANQMEHFIRKASFRGGGESIGFLVPTPNRPQLEESGNAAFGYLADITAPTASFGGGFPLGCSVAAPVRQESRVRLIEEKTVAGFDAVVLAADSGKELMEWLRERDYAFTPEAAAWAQPYLENGWYITAMRVTKNNEARAKSEVSAAALRISFKTERPLFPYREPDSRGDAAQLGINHRLLRIYFVAESRYEGRFSAADRWTGKTRYSQPLQAEQRTQLLQHLNLPRFTGPSQVWLTEFEDSWPYGKAPGDVYFSPAADQAKFSRDLSAAGKSFDPTLVLVIAGVMARPLFQRIKSAR
jgi:hypothetical protein